MKQLVEDIQTQHHAKVVLEKELQSGHLELECLLKRRHELIDTVGVKESQVNKEANELVLRIAKFYFAAMPVAASRPQSRMQSPVKAAKRAQSPTPLVRPFLCGVSPPKTRKTPEKSGHMDSTSELLDLKNEAEKLLNTYYVKYGN